MLNLGEIQYLIQALNVRPFPVNPDGTPLTGAQAKQEAQNQFAVERKLGIMFEELQQKTQAAAAAEVMGKHDNGSGDKKPPVDGAEQEATGNDAEA